MPKVFKIKSHGAAIKTQLNDFDQTTVNQKIQVYASLSPYFLSPDKKANSIGAALVEEWSGCKKCARDDLEEQLGTSDKPSKNVEAGLQLKEAVSVRNELKKQYTGEKGTKKRKKKKPSTTAKASATPSANASAKASANASAKASSSKDPVLAESNTGDSGSDYVDG
jgi:hypothetical protein